MLLLLTLWLISLGVNGSAALHVATVRLHHILQHPLSLHQISIVCQLGAQLTLLLVDVGSSGVQLL